MSSGKAVQQTRNDVAGESVGTLVSQLATLSSELVRDEFALAKHEIREKVKSLSVAVLISAVGALIAQAALLALCAAAALALAPSVGGWQAVFIVGAVLVLVATTLAAIAVERFKRLDLKPVQTLETLEEDKRWLKELT
jgi:MFS family permease